MADTTTTIETAIPETETKLQPEPKSNFVNTEWGFWNWITVATIAWSIERIVCVVYKSRN